MLFNSLEFAIFFPVVAVIYFALVGRWRIYWLLTASCIFYAAFVPAYILILFLTIIIDFYAGIYLERINSGAKLWLLWISILATCCVLFVFKYFSFVTRSMSGFADLFGWNISLPALNILLPIGLSFHTFQSLSYVIEVYHGRQKSERNLAVYATYVMFFPQLVAGPIERPQNLLHQFREHIEFNAERVVIGLRRIALGLFKKVVVADRLALYVNDVYATPTQFNGLQLTIATVFFAYQIYCDFSGYSDIAIGSARILGFSLMENFNEPYRALTVNDFWRRWHISLSTWFRDYIYIPIGGSRVGESRLLVNIFVTFLISGLWHGANWTFAAWGALNGLYLVAGRLTSGMRDQFFRRIGVEQNGSVRRAIMLSTTFLLTCAAWMVFRSSNLGDAGYIFMHLARGWDFHELRTPNVLLRSLPVAFGAIVLLEAIQIGLPRLPAKFQLINLSPAIRWSVYITTIFTILLFGVFQTSQFIYFQF